MLAHDIPHATPRRLTRAEYARLGELDFFRGERVELIHGIVLRMSPIGPPHASVVARLNELFLPRLIDRATVRIGLPLAACDESEPEPDLAVVPKGRYSDHHPDGAFLVIEVAHTSLEYDRETKGPLYAASGVAEYWIVDVVARAIEIRTEPSAAGYARVRHVVIGESAAPAAFADVVISVGDLFA
jgi:Uma2 family endonuclease